jgi:hypothetical protein
MKLKNILFLPSLCFAISVLTGCGGGSNDVAPAMSVTQSRFDTWIQAGGIAGLSWVLRSPNRSASDYLFATVVSTQSSPQNAPQVVSLAQENLTSTLTVPVLNTRGVQRFVHGGAIRYRHTGTKTVIAYTGDVIESRMYAVDDQTVLATEVVDDVSAPISLTSTVGSSPDFNRHYDLFQAPVATGIDPNANWIQDAAFVTVKAYFRDPMLQVVDWSTPTYDSNVNAYNGPETTIEAFFANRSTWTFNGIGYAMNSGRIENIQGARVWVANAAFPSANYPTTTYRTLIQFNQKLYAGLYYPANNRIRYRDQIDSTQSLDYLIVLNRNALLSLRQAVSF